jgi:hypothetical protein
MNAISVRAVPPAICGLAPEVETAAVCISPISLHSTTDHAKTPVIPHIPLNPTSFPAHHSVETSSRFPTRKYMNSRGVAKIPALPRKISQSTFQLQVPATTNSDLISRSILHASALTTWPSPGKTSPCIKSTFPSQVLAISNLNPIVARPQSGHLSFSPFSSPLRRPGVLT